MVTVEQFLILEWIGRWSIPDHHHGGIYAGPYPSKEKAQIAIDMRAKHDEKSMRQPIQGCTPHPEDYIVDQIRHLRAYHTIISVPAWPVVEPIP